MIPLTNFRLNCLNVEVKVLFNTREGVFYHNYLQREEQPSVLDMIKHDIGRRMVPSSHNSSHIVNSELECSLKCREEQTCVGHNYRPKSTKYEYNCQLASNSSLEREKEIIRNGEWVFSQDLEFLPVSRLFKVTKIPVIFNLQNCS